MAEVLAVEQSRASKKLTANPELAAFNSNGDGDFARSTSLPVPADSAYTSLLAISTRDSSFMENKDRYNKPRDKGGGVERQLFGEMPKWRNFYFGKFSEVASQSNLECLREFQLQEGRVAVVLAPASFPYDAYQFGAKMPNVLDSDEQEISSSYYEVYEHLDAIALQENLFTGIYAYGSEKLSVIQPSGMQSSPDEHYDFCVNQLVTGALKPKFSSAFCAFGNPGFSDVIDGLVLIGTAFQNVKKIPKSWVALFTGFKGGTIKFSVCLYNDHLAFNLFAVNGYKVGIVAKKFSDSCSVGRVNVVYKLLSFAITAIIVYIMRSWSMDMEMELFVVILIHSKAPFILNSMDCCSLFTLLRQHCWKSLVSSSGFRVYDAKQMGSRIYDVIPFSKVYVLQELALLDQALIHPASNLTFVKELVNCVGLDKTSNKSVDGDVDSNVILK